MPLPIPVLDDRTFDQLVAEGRSLIPRYTRVWTNHNVSDSGITLLEQSRVTLAVRVSLPEGKVTEVSTGKRFEYDLRRKIGDDADRALVTGSDEVPPEFRKLVEEYGRHTGHADLLREAVDGLVGEDPPW